MQSAIKYSAIIALAMLSACAGISEQEPEAPAPFDPTPGTEPIAFCASSPGIIVMPQSRSKDPLTQDNISDPEQLMGVYTLYTGRQTIADCPTPTIYSNNHLFYHFAEKDALDRYIWKGATRNGTDFKHTPLFWPIDHRDNLTFFAYAPYDDCAGGTDAQLLSAEIVDKELIIDYRPDNVRLQRQLDLSFSRPIVDKSQNDVEDDGHRMEFIFDKSLTRVQLYARYVGNLPDGFTVKITDITLKNILGQRKVAISPFPKPNPDDKQFTWLTPDYSSDNMVDYSLSISNNYMWDVTLKNSTDTPTDPSSEDLTLSSNYTVLQKYDGILLLVPQHITPESYLDINYNVYNNNTYITTLHDEIKLQETDWNPGTIYGYFISVWVGEVTPVEFNSDVIVDGTEIGIVSYEEYEESGNSVPEIIIP